MPPHFLYANSDVVKHTQLTHTHEHTLPYRSFSIILIARNSTPPLSSYTQPKPTQNPPKKRPRSLNPNTTKPLISHPSQQPKTPFLLTTSQAPNPRNRFTEHPPSITISQNQAQPGQLITSIPNLLKERDVHHQESVRHQTCNPPEGVHTKLRGSTRPSNPQIPTQRPKLPAAAGSLLPPAPRQRDAAIPNSTQACSES